MKIAKYLFLLLLLLFGTISVFVATKDGNYTVERKKIIDVPKETVYKYVSNVENWDSINPWKNSTFKLTKIQNLDSETITQNISLNEVTNELKLTVKDTLLKKSIVTWTTQGSLSFKDKFLSMIGRGTKNNFDEKLDEGLTRISTVLNREINSFNVKLEGFVRLDTLFYIQRPISCKAEDLPKNIKLFLPKLKQLLITTNTESNGSPFIIYHKKDTINDKLTFSIAIPTKRKVYTTSESDIYNGQTEPFGAVKATLTGNYNNKKEARTKINEFIKLHKLEQSPTYKEIEFIPRNITTEKSASTWVTEIHVPVRPLKPKPVKKKIQIQDSTTNPINEFQ